MRIGLARRPEGRAVSRACGNQTNDLPQDPKVNGTWRFLRIVAVTSVCAALVLSLLNPNLLKLTADNPTGSNSASQDKNPSQEATQLNTNPLELSTRSTISNHPERLLFLGAQLGRDAFSGYALLGTDPAHPQTYAAGALLANGARIAEIYKDRIVLERNGRRMQLFADGPNRIKGGNIRDASELALVGGDTSQSQREDPPPGAEAIDHLSPYIRFTPVFEGDATAGLAIIPGERTDAIANVGLKAGDVVTAINGSPIHSARDAFASLRKLGAGEQIVVTVMDSNGVRTLSIDGRVLTADRTL